MNHHAIVHGRIGRDYDRVTANLVTTRRRDVSVIAAFDLVSMRASKDLTAISLDCRRQPAQVFQRMKLPLSRKMQTGPGIETLQGRAFQSPDVSQPGAMRGR